MRTTFLFAGLGCLLCAACGGDEVARPTAAQLAPSAVRVEAAGPQTVVIAEEVSGTIRAKHRASLEAKLAGRIDAMYAVAGQAVRKGQLLAHLDLEEVDAQLAQAIAVRVQAENDLARYEALLARGAATAAELDAAEARARVAQAAVDEVQALLGRAAIVAPFDGVVTRKLAEVGDLAVPGKPLVEIEDPTVLRAEADVGESLITGIRLGQRLTVHVPSVAAPIEGTVVEIAPTADPGSRTFVVKLDLPPTPGLRAGAFARVDVLVGQSDTLLIPAAAVFVRGQLEFVFLVANGKAELRLVRTGRRHGDAVELLAGVSAGEQVIVSGAAGLREGQPLQIGP
jgi:RND family efflux transporter MFP subunit